MRSTRDRTTTRETFPEWVSAFPGVEIGYRIFRALLLYCRAGARCGVAGLFIQRNVELVGKSFWSFVVAYSRDMYECYKVLLEIYWIVVVILREFC